MTTAGLDLSKKKHTKNQFPKKRKGYVRQFRDNHWKALGEENPNLPCIFL